MLGLSQQLNNQKLHKPTFVAFYAEVKGLFVHLPKATFTKPYRYEAKERSALKYIGECLSN